MTKKAIQLTNRNPEAQWKQVKDGKTVFINMADMDDAHLQAALYITQIKKVRAFLEFKNDSKREQQLLQAAKERNLILLDVGYEPPRKDNIFIESRFVQFKEIMTTAYTSILRKLAKETKKEEV